MDKQNAKNEKDMVDLLNQETKELQSSKKQIEELQMFLCKHNPPCSLADWDDCERIADCKKVKRQAEELYNAGYRKIPENAVVLTREEKQEYESFVKLLIYDKPIKNRVYEFIKDTKDQARKETAEKFAERAKEAIINMKWARDDTHIKLVEQGDCLKAIDEIAKELTGDKA